MKKLLLISLCYCIITNVFAQNNSAKLSPFTKIFLKETVTNTDKFIPSSKFVYKNIGNRIFVSAIVKIKPTFDDSQFHIHDVIVGTKAGLIRTVQVPVENFTAFTKMSGLDYIQIDEPVFPTLDNARIDTRVDSVHNGYSLPMRYNGDGVVMGVVDVGFDFKHPAFFDTTGVNYRIRKVWLQKDNTGSAPAGYSYGTEETDSTTLWNIGTDAINSTHGTHVAGICAGSGYRSQTSHRRFRGVGYKTDLVMVGITPTKDQWINTGVSDMIDGIQYIFDYASSVSKPAVVNLSWGSPLGPHDGTGLFSQALDNLTGPGRIFVCSAGNNGEDSIHIQKQFSPSDTLVQTFLSIADSPEGQKTWLDIWGEAGKTFCLNISLFNNSVVASTGEICLDDSVHTLTLLDSNNDTCSITIVTAASEFNGKPRIFVDFDNRATDSILISISANDGLINMWNSFVSNTSGYYGAFRSYNKPNVVNGDYELTVSDIASTISAISVGAYASKIQWTNILSQTFSYSNYVSKGELVPFSSHGPTSDGRVKPDIAGPGMTIGSAISSYDSSFMTAGNNYLFVINKFHDTSNNHDYPYGMLSGTSMSSPAVSGITSLLLQVKPDLSPQEVKDIYTLTAITDSYTGIIPPGGNSTWGNGKVNAMGSVMRAVQLVTNVNTISNTGIACSVFPNPNAGDFSIDYLGINAGNLQLECFDLTGKLVKQENWQTTAGYNSNVFNWAGLSNGAYYLHISGKEGRAIIKMIISR
jgi:minor extracellular serine protease Vpr